MHGTFWLTPHLAAFNLVVVQEVHRVRIAICKRFIQGVGIDIDAGKLRRQWTTRRNERIFYQIRCLRSEGKYDKIMI